MFLFAPAALLFLVAASAAAAAAAAVPVCPDSPDCAPLQALWAATRTPSGARLPWPPTAESGGGVCDWPGVTCWEEAREGTANATSVPPQTVRVLDLHTMGLRGVLPPELGALTRPESLFLSANELSGGIPPELGNLGASLRDLLLAQNLLEGPLPPALGRLGNLTTLDVSFNKLTGALDPRLPAGLASLRSLKADYNQLQGPLPDNLGDMSNLLYCVLSYNQFVGPVPASVQRMTSLFDLELANNYFTRIDGVEWGQMTSLTSLSLGFNRLSGPLPARALASMPALVGLFLENNNFSGPLDPDVEWQRSLLQLELDHNQLEGPVPDSLGRMGALQTLHLQNNRLTGPLPDGWGAGLQSVVSLFLAGNALVGPLPAALEKLLCNGNFSSALTAATGTNTNTSGQCSLGGNNFTQADCQQNPCAARYCGMCLDGAAAAGANKKKKSATSPCRDRLTQPFASTSIWNTAVGSNAVFVPAGLYPTPAPAPTPTGGDVCAGGRDHPHTRTGCPGWQKNWTPANCLSSGCCYDPHPSPDPDHLPWCFANASSPSRNGGPAVFYVDIDYFVAVSADDPQTPFVDQGWWGVDDECGRDHCCRKRGSVEVGTVPFPVAWTVNMTSNNAAALLLPDNETLVQFQPLVRCTPGSALFSAPSWRRDTYYNGTAWVPVPGPQNMSILGDGVWGAHGGSRLSSIGGTIRLGELLPGAPPIGHALKLMLWAEQYYWPGNATVGCYRWPALNCDGSWNASKDPANSNFYNGTEPKLRPGALLAVPAAAAAVLAPRMVHPVGRRILAALRDYGGYLDDNTAHDSAAFNVEGGVVEEVAAAYGGLNLRSTRPGEPLYADLLSIYRALHIVDNNGPAAKGGGGAPRMPPKPPICT